MIDHLRDIISGLQENKCKATTVAIPKTYYKSKYLLVSRHFNVVNWCDLADERF